jgi:hypothetical protein
MINWEKQTQHQDHQLLISSLVFALHLQNTKNNVALGPLGSSPNRGVRLLGRGLSRFRAERSCKLPNALENEPKMNLRREDEVLGALGLGDPAEGALMCLG